MQLRINARVFQRPITWCGKVFFADDVSHIPERIEGLLAMRGSETEGELVQFL